MQAQENVTMALLCCLLSAGGRTSCHHLSREGAGLLWTTTAMVQVTAGEIIRYVVKKLGI